MNILVVHCVDIAKYPPVRNLVTVLAQLGHNVTVLTRNRNHIYFANTGKIKIIPLPENKYNYGLLRVFNYTRRVSFLRRMVDKEMEHNDILWTTTDSTVRELKGRVLRYKHILQLMELIEETRELSPFQFIKINMPKYARHAYRVVVPEYNRAHIQKTWWNLNRLPTILPNKPVDDVYNENIPKNVLNIINDIKREKRKIILYMGVFGKDRYLEMFFNALNPLSNHYCCCLLGEDNDYRKELCAQYSNIKYLGYVLPPFHLVIASFAHIALLSYVPARGKCDNQSDLNALYCAPNKIYEYAKYGVPMIGNDVPGLALPFDKYNIGKIYHGGGVEEMRTIIEKIEANYQNMSENCRKFYNDTNLHQIVEDILS